MEVHNVLIKKHSRDFAGEFLTERLCDNRVDGVTNELFLLVQISHLLQSRRVHLRHRQQLL